MKPLITLLLMVFTLCSAPLSAHETWLMPNQFVLEPGRSAEVHLTTSTLYPGREFTSLPSSVKRKGLRTATGELPLTDLESQPRSLRIRTPSLPNGAAVLWAELEPTEVLLADKLIQVYLDEIDATAEVRAAASKLSGKPWQEVFVKHAKTCLWVGPGIKPDPSVCTQAVGLALELVPLQTPAELKPGQTQRFKLLWQGKPLPGLSVGRLTDSSATRQFQRTNAQGEVSFALDAPGRVMFFAVYLRAPNDGKDQWQSDFTTFTVQVKK